MKPIEKMVTVRDENGKTFTGVYAKGTSLYIKIKLPTKKGEPRRWQNRFSGFQVGHESEAAELRKEIQGNYNNPGGWVVGYTGRVTIAAYSTHFIKERQKRGVATWKDDESRLRDHFLPLLGHRPIREVKVKDIGWSFQHIRTKVSTGELAPKTVHNIYGTVRSLFKSALKDDLISTSPCILDDEDLGKRRDKDPAWRKTALFKRAELEAIIFSPLIPTDRRVLYSLLGLAGLRIGEACGLRWGAYDPNPDYETDDFEIEILGDLFISKSFNGPTKTRVVRNMPVHPVLAEILGEWRRSGWPAMMGRSPTVDDLIVPRDAPTTTNGKRCPLGSMRSQQRCWELFSDDLAKLELRHRWIHDFRRTFISLARSSKIEKDILKHCTHGPPRGEVMDGYTVYEWDVKCAEIGKLRIKRPTPLSPISTIHKAHHVEPERRVISGA